MKNLIILALLSTLTNTPTTKLEVYNPYTVELKLEVKCDHDYKTNKYKYYKIVTIRRQSNITLYTPQNLNRCEIWPLDYKVFGSIK